MHCIGTNGTILKACLSVEGNLHSHIPPTFIITVHVFPLSLLVTHPESISDCVYFYSATLYLKRADLSANCGVPFRSKGLCSRFLAAGPYPYLVQFSFPLNAIFAGSLLGAFAKRRKATISFVVSVCLSVRPSVSVRMKQLGSHRTDFNGIWCLNIFLKSIDNIQLSFNSDSNLYCTLRREYIYDNISLNSS